MRRVLKLQQKSQLTYSHNLHNLLAAEMDSLSNDIIIHLILTKVSLHVLVTLQLTSKEMYNVESVTIDWCAALLPKRL